MSIAAQNLSIESDQALSQPIPQEVSTITDVAGPPDARARTLPWPRPAEKRRLWLVIPVLALFGCLLGWALWIYFVPACAGVDQNGYLCTARLITEDHRLSFVRDNVYQFAGKMMVLAPAEVHHGILRVYAKYPFGYPLLAAIGRWLGGVHGMYMVNPVCTLLACLLSFFLFRTVVSNFSAAMGVLWLAANPVTLYWSNDAASHASTLLCVILGFWGLLSWFENGGTWRGLLGGLALGYACTIRYSEFLLVIPVLFVALARIRWNPMRLRESLPPLLGWAIPVAALALSCWIAYGAPWQTGYAMCKEQTGFGWKYFWGNPDAIPIKQGNWETLIYQLNHTGMFLMLSASLVGLVGLFWHSWKLGTTIALWVFPSTILYMFYYWAPGNEDSMAYMRFFLTVFPGLILAGLWVFDRALAHNHWARAFSLGILTLVGCGINIANIEPHLNQSQEHNLLMSEIVDRVEASYPRAKPHQVPNVIFADDYVCDQLDCIGGYKLYSFDLFNPAQFNHYRALALVSEVKMEEPNPIQRSRAEEYVKLLGDEPKPGKWVAKSPAELDKAQTALMQAAFDHHQRVAIIIHGDVQHNMIAHRGWSIKKLSVWSQPPAIAPETNGLLTRWIHGQRVQPRPRTDAELKAVRWTLYEILPDAPAKAASAAGKANSLVALDK